MTLEELKKWIVGSKFDSVGKGTTMEFSDKKVTIDDFFNKMKITYELYEKDDKFFLKLEESKTDLENDLIITVENQVLSGKTVLTNQDTKQSITLEKFV